MIHCSPLFHPLEPLPIMNPTVMRSQSKKMSARSSRSGSSSKTSPNLQSVEANGTRNAKRKYSNQCHTTHPLADTPLTMPVTDPMPPPPLLHSRSEDRIESLLLAASASNSQEIHSASSYQASSFDSQLQGSLTFTVESQPMSDLSSSQQQSQG